MNVEEITMIMDSTNILKDMCSNNHQHTITLNQELQKLVQVIMTLEQRITILEKKERKRNETNS